MKVTIEIDKPETCGDCPFYSRRSYQCHNERGYMACCSLGYMDKTDTRDGNYSNSLFEGCRLGLELESK